jgi:hypothetical protein
MGEEKLLEKPEEKAEGHGRPGRYQRTPAITPNK